MNSDQDKVVEPLFPLKEKFPELYRSDVSIHPSYTNLKVPYKEICRERKNVYVANKVAKYQAEVWELKMQQVRAWDGVRVYRLLYRTPFPTYRSVMKDVVNPLTPEESRRVYYIMKD